MAGSLGRGGRAPTGRRRPVGRPDRAAVPAQQPPSTSPAEADGGGLPLAERRLLRDAFFRDAGVDPRQFLQAFDHVPGLSYFVKDADGRTMLNTREYTRRMGYQTADDVVGKRPREYLSKDLADHYAADDRRVMESGEPLRNIVEVGFNERGVPDWIVTDKYPLRDAAGRVVGIVGTIQGVAGRARALPHLGPVGRAADFVRRRLSDRLSLAEVAAHVGLSERQLQRLFRKELRMPVQQFVIHSRVHAAAHELTRSDRPMSEIALMFGFCDQSAFTNTFRRLTGLPPRDFRARYLKDMTG